MFFKVPWNTMYCKKISCFLFLVNIQYHNMSKWYHGIAIWKVRFSFLGVFFCFVRVQCVTEANLVFCVFHLSNTGTISILFKEWKTNTSPLQPFIWKYCRAGPIKTAWDNDRWGKWPATADRKGRQSDKENTEEIRQWPLFTHLVCSSLRKMMTSKNC